MRPTTWISLVYSVLGATAYLLTIVAIIGLRKKVFPMPFVAIYMVAAVVNLATHVNTWIMYRLRFEPVFFFYYRWIMQPELELIKDIQQFLVSYFYFAQNACACVFTLNRYTAICHTTRHENIWKFYPLIIGVIHIVSFGTCLATRWPAKADFALYSEQNVFVLVPNPTTSVMPVMISMLSFGAVMLIFCSAMSLLSIYNLRKITHTQIDRNLTIIVLCVFAAQAANIIVVIINSVAVFRRDWATIGLLSDVLPFLSDLFSLGPAAYTLLLSSNIRKYYIKMIIKVIGRQGSTVVHFPGK